MKKLKIDKNVIKWLLKAAGTVKGSLLALFLIKVAQGGVGVGFAFVMRTIVDAATSGNAGVFRKSLIAGCLVILAEIGLYWGSIYYKEKPAALLSMNIRQRTFAQLLKRSYGKVFSVHTGEWMTRINSDSAIIANAITAIIPGTAGLIVQISCAIIAMFIILPRMAWMLIPVAAAMILVSLVLRIRLKEFHREVQKREGLAHSFLQESLASMAIIRTYTMEEEAEKEAGKRLNGIVKAKLSRAVFISWCSSAVYTLVRVSYFLGVGICGVRLLNGVISYGMMAAVLQLIRQADLPLSEVTMAVPQFFNMIASAERLMEIEKLEPDSDENAVIPAEAAAFYESDFSAIEIDRVSFSYDAAKAEPVLKDLTLRVEKGDYVAFTGGSGFGKSTTMSLLMGLYKPDSGSISLIKRDGEKLPLDARWRALFAYVPQENLLMSGTIREVVSFADSEGRSDDERLWQALKIACADGFVRELPEGLDANLGERGAGLSEGQMQRIAIARAVFSGRPVLMLDEATSALDEMTEKMLLENLRSMTDRTVIIITHRPAALAICNRQLAFQKS